MPATAKGTIPTTRLPPSNPADGHNDGKIDYSGLFVSHMLCNFEAFCSFLSLY